MKNKLVLSFIIFLFFYEAQGQMIQFEKHFNYHTYTWGKAIVQLPDDGYLVGGTVIDTLTVSEANMFLMRTDRFGDTIWTKHYDFATFPVGQQSIVKIFFQPNGEIILFGTVYANQSWIQMMKADSSGNIIWAKKYSRLTTNYLYDVLATSDNSFLLSFISDSTFSINYDEKNILMKVDTSGGVLWKNYLVNDSTIFSGIAEVNQSYYAVASTPSTTDMIKFSTNGNYINSTKWQAYGGQTKIIKTHNDHLTIATMFFTFTDHGVLLFNSDTSGNITWNRIFSELSIVPPIVIETKDSGFAVISQIGCTAPYNISFIKTNSQGDTLSTRIYGTGDENHPGAGVQTSDNGFAITGVNEYPLCLIKTDSDGNSGCSDHCPDIFVDSIVITGLPGSYSFYNDTIFVTSLIGTTYSGINETTECFYLGTNEILGKKTSFIIFPNPVATLLNISLNKKEEITIFDLIGDVVFQKNYSLIASGKNEIDVSFLSAGIYFVKVGNDVQKFVKE